LLTNKKPEKLLQIFNVDKRPNASLETTTGKAQLTAKRICNNLLPVR